jgi:hypothetical protein
MALILRKRRASAQLAVLAVALNMVASTISMTAGMIISLNL